MTGIGKAKGLSNGLFPGVEGLYIPQPAVNPIKLGSVGFEQHSSFNTYDSSKTVMSPEPVLPERPSWYQQSKNNQH